MCHDITSALGEEKGEKNCLGLVLILIDYHGWTLVGVDEGELSLCPICFNGI